MEGYLQAVIYFGLAIILGGYIGLSRHSKKGLLKIPFGLLVFFFLLMGLVPIFKYAHIEETSSSLRVAASIVLWMAIARIAVYLVVDYILRQKRGVLIPTITRDFGLAIIYFIIAMIVIKHRTNVNLGALLTTSAILTAVIGFAMQDTLGNLFSGLALQMEHPYQIGDWIGFEGIVGKVEGITWKSTKILTRTEELIFVPNNTIAKSTLTNFSRPTPRHIVHIEVGISYNEPPHKARQAILEVLADHPNVLHRPEPSVRVVKYNDFSVDYKIFFATEDVEAEEKTKAEILNNLWYKFRRKGIKIPYPIRDLYHFSPGAMKEEEKKRLLLQEEDILKDLGRIEIFGSLSNEALKQLAEKTKVLHFAGGEKIVRQNDKPGPMYILKNGLCSVTILRGDGIETEIATLCEGQFFGEMSVLTGAPRTASIKAISDASCYEIEKELLSDIFKTYPDTMEKIAHCLMQRKEELNLHISTTSAQTQSKKDNENQLLAKIKTFFGL